MSYKKDRNAEQIPKSIDLCCSINIPTKQGLRLSYHLCVLRVLARSINIPIKQGLRQ